MRPRLASTLHVAVVTAATAFLYFAAARLLVSLSAPPDGVVVAVWLSSGVSVAAYIVFGPIAALGAILGSAAFELSIGTPPLGAGGMALANAFSEFVAYWIIIRGKTGTLSLQRTGDVLRFLTAAVIASVSSATLGVADYVAFGVLRTADFWSNWLAMFGSVVVGILLLTPFLVHVAKVRGSTRGLAGGAELALTILAVTMTTLLWQSTILPDQAREPALILVALPLVFAAFRFSPLSMSITMVSFGLAASIGAMQRLSNASMPTSESLFTLQFMMSSVATVSYFLFSIVSERGQAHESLRLAAKVFENSNDGIVITLADGTIVDVNDAYTRIHGLTRESVIGRNPRIWKSECHPPEFYEEMWRSLTTRGEWRGEIWDRRADGSLVPKWQSIAAVKDEHGKTSHYVGVFSDITAIKEAEDRLKKLATHDPLTDLPNRNLAKDRLAEAITRGRRQDTSVALMFFDLDGFKNVNDSLGHAKGDELLVQVAGRVSSLLRASDVVARQGGDEFIVVVPDIRDMQDVDALAHRLLESISRPYQLGSEAAHVSASMGIAVFPLDGDDPATLIQHADVAMYRAKELGRNRAQYFSAQLKDDFHRRMRIESGLRNALDRRQFFLEYQPQVDLRTGSISGVEALLRWRTEDGVVVGPDEFIPVAEESGLIVPIGEWVLHQACRDVAALRAGGFPDMIVAVNFSTRQFGEPDFVARIGRALRVAGLPAAALRLEVTETALMYDPEDAAGKLEALRREGVHISLDDFGTGYSSLKYAHRFSPGELKIDHYFVRGIPEVADSRAIVLATLALARSLGIEAVAEGTETEEQVRFLRAQACCRAQGYYFSRPLRIEELVRLLERGPFDLPAEAPHLPVSQPAGERRIISA